LLCPLNPADPLALAHQLQSPAHFIQEPRLRRTTTLIVALLFASLISAAQSAPKQSPTTAEQRAARYLDSVRKQPSLLFEFLRNMPKGGDLHNHLTGAVYAETYIQTAASDGLCVDRKSLALSPPPCSNDADAGRVPAARALADPVLYREMIDAFSMRHFSGALQSGHDHFFDTFGKFGAVSRTHTGDWLAEVVSRAASQNVEYMEITMNLERGRALALGTQLGWDDNFDRFRQKVDANGAADIVSAVRKFLDDSEAEMRTRMHCDQPASSKQARTDPGCDTTVRYIAEVYRGLPKEQVFAQMQISFELAAADPRVVAVNPVMPEDGFTSMHDFDLHMRMFDFFHKLYPKVHLTLHAGELAPALVPPEGLRSHIRESIERAHAERIGHGVDVMYEDDAFGLLREMREKNVMVEICLTSNDMILGVRGDRHPLPMYMKFGVPVALATDDEGVARSNITQEYQRAVETYGLSYLDLKRFARNAVEHGFADDATKSRVRQRLAQDFADFEKNCCDVKP
jgi:adenosine deaminase